jgi:hypothetical protein
MSARSTPATPASRRSASPWAGRTPWGRRGSPVEELKALVVEHLHHRRCSCGRRETTGRKRRCSSVRRGDTSARLQRQLRTTDLRTFEAIRRQRSRRIPKPFAIPSLLRSPMPRMQPRVADRFHGKRAIRESTINRPHFLAQPMRVGRDLRINRHRSPAAAGTPSPGASLSLAELRDAFAPEHPP